MFFFLQKGEAEQLVMIKDHVIDAIIGLLHVEECQIGNNQEDGDTFQY